jgi:signal transduction histidine kinase
VTDLQQTILYIEDDPASRSLVERTLRHAGYRVLVAERGLEGIDIARRECPDLILTDINLPDLSGREITTRLRGDARFERTPIVALTAMGYGENQALALAAGVTGYMTKPVDVEALTEQVAFYLQGGSDSIEPAALAEAQTRYTREVVAHLEEQIRELETRNLALKRLDLVHGYSRLLADLPAVKSAIESDEMTRTMIQGLHDGIKRMQDIINEILTISRIMTNQIDLSIGPVDPGLTAEKAVKGLQEALKTRQVTLHFERTEWPERMRGDGELLKLMFSNLLTNAIKYTPDGGEVFFSAEADAETICVRVRDTGIGVALEEQQRIFERFHTAGDTRLHSTSKTAFRGGGLGLGLAVCKGVAEAHGGSIRVESPGFDPENCPGSTFIVTLPVNLAYRKPGNL